MNFTVRVSTAHVRYIATAMLLMVLACSSLTTSGQQLSEVPLVLKAKNCEVIAHFEWDKRNAGFSEKIESAELFAAVDTSALRGRYIQTSADHADLIFKFNDDLTLDQITLEVLDPDTNERVYFEVRDRVDLENDVKRLIAHFFAAVDRERGAAKAEEQPTEKGSDSHWTESDASTGYVWVGRFTQATSAQDTAKKVEALGLPATVETRNSAEGQFYVVVSGPYSADRKTSSLDYLKAQGFSSVAWIKVKQEAKPKDSN
jgi:SPOR domain